jgi:RHS repeat-associated protein
LAAYANSTTYFNHSDWLGTVRAWSNVSGSSVGTCTSLPFGDAQTCTGTSANSWDYTGLPFDSESGMTHALFRQLSTTQGRWTTSDPAGMAAVDPTNPQSWNRYAYVNNTPTNAVDPLGLYCPVIPLGTPFFVQQSLAGQIHCSEPGDDVWFYGTGPDGYDGSGFCGTCAPPSYGFQSGFSVGFSGGGCDSDFMPCGLPMPSLYQSIWSDVLGLPSGLNCPQTGGVFGPLCGGVSPIMDVGPSPCLTSATDNAIKARTDFEAGNETRILVSTGVGIVTGAATGWAFGKVALLIPFAGPFVRVGTGTVGALGGALIGGTRNFVRTAIVNTLREDFITWDTFMGSWTGCESTTPPANINSKPF